MEAVRFGVRVRPGARRTAVGGRWGDDGALVVAVTERATQGRANRAVREAVAEAFGVAARDVEIVSGERSRLKVVAVTAPADRVSARLQELLDG